MWPSRNKSKIAYNMCNSLQFHAVPTLSGSVGRLMSALHALCNSKMRRVGLLLLIFQKIHTSKSVHWSRLRRCMRTRARTIRPSEIPVLVGNVHRWGRFAYETNGDRYRLNGHLLEKIWFKHFQTNNCKNCLCKLSMATVFALAECRARPGMREPGVSHMLT